MMLVGIEVRTSSCSFKDLKCINNNVELTDVIFFGTGFNLLVRFQSSCGLLELVTSNLLCNCDW